MDSKAKQMMYYNRKAGPARPPLKVGQTVRYKPSADEEWRKGEIVDKLPFHSYRVRMPDGSMLRSTSRHVRFSTEPPIIMDYSELSPTIECKTSSLAAAAGNATQSSSDLSTSPTHAAPAMKAETQPTTKTRYGRAIAKPARYR